jgi:hypothetical protein
MSVNLDSEPWVQPPDHRAADGGALQGNRVKESAGDEGCEEVVVPGGDLTAGAQRNFA